MTTISDTFTNPSGAAVGGVQVRATLVAASVVLSGGGAVIRETETTTASDGTWSLTLTPISSLAVPDGAYYLVTADGHRWTIDVPDSGTYTLDDVQVEPGPLPSTGATTVALADHAADTTDVHGIADTAALATTAALGIETTARLAAVAASAVYVAADDAGADEKARAHYVCDGTDDDVQIQAAIADALAAGLPVRLSTGHFVVGAPIEIEDSITFLGMGRGVTTIEAGAGLNDYIIRFTSESSEGVIGARFADFTLDGHCDTQTTDGGGIWAAGAVQCVFERIRTHNCFNWGLVLGPTFTAGFGHHNRVTGCLFDASLLSGGLGGGVWCTSSDENWFALSDFEFLGGATAPAGLSTPVALYDQAGLQKIVNACFVGGRNDSKMIFSRDTKLTQIVACTFDGSAGDAITVSGTRHLVQGNVITSAGDQGSVPASGIYLEFGAQGCVVTGNVIDSSNTAGKTFALIRETGDGDAGGNIITNNSLWVNAAVTSSAGALDASGAGSTVAQNVIGPPVP